jgi:starch synthase
MIAMRYGCVPVARTTGGLVDTITNISRKVDHGTGYLFQKPYPSTFAYTLKKAIKQFNRPAFWKKIQLNGMNIDFSWEHSARDYIRVYRDMTGNR